MLRDRTGRTQKVHNLVFRGHSIILTLFLLFITLKWALTFADNLDQHMGYIFEQPEHHDDAIELDKCLY